MTRAERENVLHCLKVMIDEEVCEECNLYGTTGTDHCEADCVRMAIKLLEQEPTTKNDLGVDCISRADAIHAVSEALKRTFVEYEDIANKVIGKLPSVTPQPKHGIWQQINKNEVNVIPEYRCSECGAEYKGFGFDFDYCPRCGCAMEEEE